MPRRKKIIHFSFGSSGRHASKPSDPEYYLGGWAAHQAKALAKADRRIRQEVWRPEYELDRVGEKRVGNVTGRIFPSTRLLRKYHLNPVSMLLELRRECRKNDVIICLHYSYDLSSILILLMFRNFPIVLQQHGCIPFSRIRRSGLIKTGLYRILNGLNDYAFRFVDLFSVISKVEYRELRERTDTGTVVLEHGRKYFKEWNPVEKRTAKKRLGIGRDTQTLLSVGRLNRIRGVDAVLETFVRLKKNRAIQLILIGVDETDELFQEARRAGAILRGVVPNRQLVHYYSAADAYVYYSENQKLKDYAGIGTAPIEAMACNVPVVSTQLVHFPTEEWRQVGEIPKDRNDLHDCIVRVLDNPRRYHPRQTARKYYDFEDVVARDLKRYERLFKEYYAR
jgi:glycosyltransferase involved in cell wall biosynthesis